MVWMEGSISIFGPSDSLEDKDIKNPHIEEHVVNLWQITSRIKVWWITKEQNIILVIFWLIKYRPFAIPEGVFDEKRLISDKEYEEKFKSGLLKRNTIDPKYIQQASSWFGWVNREIQKLSIKTMIDWLYQFMILIFQFLII